MKDVGYKARKRETCGGPQKQRMIVFFFFPLKEKKRRRREEFVRDNAFFCAFWSDE
jgi:hypothetical protein